MWKLTNFTLHKECSYILNKVSKKLQLRKKKCFPSFKSMYFIRIKYLFATNLEDVDLTSYFQMDKTLFRRHLLIIFYSACIKHLLDIFEMLLVKHLQVISNIIKMGILNLIHISIRCILYVMHVLNERGDIFPLRVIRFWILFKYNENRYETLINQYFFVCFTFSWNCICHHLLMSKKYRQN